MSAAFGAGLAGMIFAEMLRFGLVPPFGFRIEGFLRSFTDERDTEIVILSHIYLLIGCAITVWIQQFTPPTREFSMSLITLCPYAGILALGVIDAMVRFDFMIYRNSSITCCRLPTLEFVLDATSGQRLKKLLKAL